MANAREKLNAAFINGAVVLGVIIGLTTGSFLVGFLVFGIALAMDSYSGNIRLKPRDHP
jgi:hypothetical protein